MGRRCGKTRLNIVVTADLIASDRYIVLYCVFMRDGSREVFDHRMYKRERSQKKGRRDRIDSAGTCIY